MESDCCAARRSNRKMRIMGWVDLTPANIATWQQRLKAVSQVVHAEASGDTSSHSDRNFLRQPRMAPHRRTSFDAGEVVAWIFNTEDQGSRKK